MEIYALTGSLLSGNLQLADFMEANRRDKRPVHAYSLSRFGLEREDVERAFASYRARYIR